MKSYSHMSLPETNEESFIRPSLKRRRLLVLALYLSFFTSLLALWITSPIASDVGQLLPYWLIQAIIDNRLTILAIPLVCLFTCSITLRHITSDIMGGPERYLDERQKMIRDQAHRYAYRIIKLACLFVPLGLFLYSMPWTNHASVAPTPPRQAAFWLFDANGQSASFQIISAPVGPPTSVHNPVAFTIHQIAITIVHYPPVTLSTLWPTDPLSTAISYGVLLLCFFLMVTVLPIAIVAWKERG